MSATLLNEYGMVWYLGNPRSIGLNGSPDFLHGFDAAFAKLFWPLVCKWGR